MRKFLSILMLTCLLCGLALPAAAEGEETQLFAKFDESVTPQNALTIPKGLSRTITFFTTADGTDFTPISGGTFTNSGDAINLTESGGTYVVEGVALTEGTPVTISQNDSSLAPVNISVVESHLELSKDNGVTWLSSLSDLSVGIPVSVRFRVGADGIFDNYTGDIAVDKPGLSVSGGKMTASKAGVYTLRVGDCTVTVSAVSNEISLSDNDLSMLADQKKFDEFLESNPHSSNIPLVLKLPGGNYGSVLCNVTLPSDIGFLTLQGTTNTNMSSLTVDGTSISVEGITFTGVPAITTNVSCSVSRCTFSPGAASTDKYAFQLQTVDDSVPFLGLEGNKFSNLELVKIVDSANNEIGRWRVQTKSAFQWIDFYAETIGTNVFIQEDKTALTDDGWGFVFETACDYEKAFVTYDGENIDSTQPAKGKIQFIVKKGGMYSIVKGTLPELVKKDATTKTLEFTPEQAESLNKFTTACDFKAVKITDKDGKAVKWEKSSDGKLTVWLTGKSPYTIVEDTKKVTTPSKTTPKTTTTKRSYNYKYQDYYLITPQRVTDCMRYAKDNLVTIECKEAGRRSISLPVASMAAAAEKGYSILLKNEKIANITMDPAALKSMAQQAKGTTVLLHYRSLNHKTLTSVGLASVQSHLDQFPNDNADLAFLLTATSDSETIEDLQMGTITLKIPFIVLPGTEEMKNEVYALQTETTASARETTVADGHLTTKLTDLTEHMVFQIGEPVETTEETTEPTVETTVETTQPETEPETVPETTFAPEPEKEEKGFPIWIPIVAVLLLGGGGAAAWFLYFRKRFKK